ncbi:Transcriptional adapter ada2 [Elasticomyces elasticus]|nr:Transcriptional adapter ada2 [Elasticomyces elasticus]
MGLLRKKTAVRATEGGVKYQCDVCGADITSTVRIRCADKACEDYDLCVPCFADGKASKNHDPRSHAYQVIEQHAIPIFDEDWGADEELLLLEGAETYGLGSWADIADHIGGYRTKDEVRDHFIETYINSSKFPLSERASPGDNRLADTIPREEFQARKKRRIEARKEAVKDAPPIDPSKSKMTSSVPACHEVAGYMPGRLEFETEYLNEAEEAVQHMHFDPGDGRNARGELEPEMDLKMTVMEIYANRLTQRVERKRLIFEHNLLEYKKNTTADKKRTKEERELVNKVKPFARMMNHDDFVAFSEGIEQEHSLRAAIAQLQEWRKMGIKDLKAGEKYEQEKAVRLARTAPSGQMDRFSASQRVANKPVPPVETPSALAALTAPELPLRLQNGGLHTPPDSVSPNGKSSNGVANDTTTLPPPQRQRFVLQPLPNVSTLKLTNENAPDLQLLSPEEQELCEKLRLMPKAYNAIKTAVIAEAIKNGGVLKKKQIKEISRIDAVKASRLCDYFVWAGWIQKG